jgi:hypothetical protein
MARKLENIEVEEVSIVDAAANRKKFGIIKRRSEVDEFITIIKSMAGELSDEELEKAKALPADAQKAIAGALNILNKYKADYPADVLDAIKTLTKYSSYGYGYPAKKSEDEELTKEDIEKIGARLSKATLEQLKIAKEILGGFDLKSLKKVSEIIDQLISSATVDKYAGLPEDVRKRLMKQDEEEAEKARKAEEAKVTGLIKSTLDEALKPLRETVDKLAKAKGIKKSVDGQDTDDDQDKDAAGDKWPSLSGS